MVTLGQKAAGHLYLIASISCDYVFCFQGNFNFQILFLDGFSLLVLISLEKFYILVLTRKKGSHSLGRF